MTEVQSRILDILKVIINICEKQNIRYYAFGGTLLGAVRHKGFIPWDDDIDIAMPREDYDRFFQIAEQYLPPYYKTLTPLNTPMYENNFNKIVDVRTTCIHRKLIEYPECDTGVYVDIMPYDGKPKDKLFYFKIKILKSLNYRLRMPQNTWGKQIRQGSVIKILTSLMKKTLTYDYFYKKYLSYLHKCTFDNADKICHAYSKFARKLTIPKTIFNQSVKLQFEDILINCPVGWEEYLTIQYGNYMILPPLEERTGVHDSIIDLDHSFQEYRRLYL